MQNISMDEKQQQDPQQQRKAEQQNERISTSLEMQSTSNAMITQNVMVKCSRKHQRKSFDEDHRCKSQGASGTSRGMTSHQ